MKIEHFFLMAGLGEVAHFDVDQLSDLLRKNPIRPERQRRKVRRWEDSKIYLSKLYEGPTIPLLGQGLVLTKRPGMDAPPCEERGFPALPCETPLRQGPQKTVKTVGRWLGKIKESHDKTIWQHWTMIMVIILTHLLLYTSKLLKYTCWVYNVLGSRWTCVKYFNFLLPLFCQILRLNFFSLYIYRSTYISLKLYCKFKQVKSRYYEVCSLLMYGWLKYSNIRNCSLEWS